MMEAPSTLPDTAHFPYDLFTNGFGRTVLVGLACFVFASLTRVKPGSRANFSLALFSTGLFLTLTGLAGWMLDIQKWGYVLAFLPGAIIARHAIYLRLVRRGSFDPEPQKPDGLSDTQWKRLAPLVARVRRNHQRDFSAEVLIIRYGIPALLSIIVVISAFEIVAGDVATKSVEHMHSLDPKVIVGASYALAGSYVYALVQLGQRSMRNDLTSGAAMWNAISLALGPIVGGVLAMFYHPETTANGFGPQAVYFVAGLTPRYAAGVIEETVKRLWNPGATATQPTRSKRLITLRGVDAEIEERLAEEGIRDVAAMAMADPLKLYRNTSFDRRLILSWIDEALLSTFLDDAALELQKKGFPGAIDLASLYSDVFEDEEEPKRRATPQLDLTGIAKAAGLEREELVSLIERIYFDAQVNLVWTLYQFEEAADDVEEESASGSAARNVASMSMTPSGGRDFAKVSWILLIVLGGAAYLARAWEPPAASILFVLAATCAGGALFLLVAKQRRIVGGVLLILAAAAQCAAGAYVLRNDEHATFPFAIVAGVLVALGFGACVAQGIAVVAEARAAEKRRRELRVKILNHPPPDGVKIAVDPSNRVFMLDEGEYLVQATAHGYDAFAERVNVKAPEGHSVDVELRRRREASPPAEPKPAPREEPQAANTASPTADVPPTSPTLTPPGTI